MEPIVILACPRTGSSLLSYIFASHGVWTGDCRAGDRLNPTGYYENRGLKQLLIQDYGKLVKVGRLATPRPGFRAKVERIIKQQGYESGPWLMKHSALYYPAWHELDPVFISPIRRVKSIAASQERAGMKADIPAHIKAMTESGSFMVDMDKVVGGDYEQLSQAFDLCRLSFDPEIAQSCIHGEYWHSAVS